MKHAVLKIALAAAALVLFVCALVGCSGGTGAIPYDHVVTFDYNFGKLNETTPNQYLGVKDGSLIALQPGKDVDNFKLQALEGYEFEGWYLPLYDENGEVARDEDGRAILGKQWNFRTGRVTEDITLYANYVKKSKLTFAGRAEVNGEIVEVPLDELSFKLLEDTYQGTAGEMFAAPSEFPPAAAGYTLLGYYADENLETEFEWPYTLVEGETTVYVKFLQGTWTIIETAKQFVDGLSLGNNLYVTANLDFTGVAWEQCDYSGTINGNGHSITNLIYDKTGSKDVLTYGLFGAIGEKAHIYDLTFKDVKVLFAMGAGNAGSEYHISLFADSIAQGASFENLHFSGTLSVTSDNAAQYTITPHIVSREYPESLENYFNENFDVTQII